MKLVRDNIPKLFPQHTYVKVDNDEMLQILLRLKLAEEAGEAVKASSRSELANELADVLEVVDALARASQIDLRHLATVRDDKHLARGGFSKGWMLR